jgi:hypothetical protein
MPHTRVIPFITLVFEKFNVNAIKENEVHNVVDHLCVFSRRFPFETLRLAYYDYSTR